VEEATENGQQVRNAGWAQDLSLTVFGEEIF